jgi:N-carbamoyl-L-amino-acid hydrolase
MTTLTTADLSIRVDRERLLSTFTEMGRFGAQPDGGVSRPGFSEAERQARDHLARRAVERGLTASIDAAGNLIIRRPGYDATAPTLMMGSHLDSVTNGGRYDGTYGVVAAVEVLTVLADRRRPGVLEPVAVAFSNEEGARFPYPFFGSRAVAGGTALPDELPAEAVDAFAIELRRSGGDLSALRSARWPTAIGAYLELHIEQGPTLERTGTPIGVVDVINGRTVFTIEVHGRQAHAGTTPMDCRADALAAAARVVMVVESIAREHRLCAVATVGDLVVEPGEANVIAGHVRLTAEMRDPGRARLLRAERELRARLGLAETTMGTRIAVDAVMRTDPVAVDTAVAGQIRAAARSLDLPEVTLPSAAGHDAQIISAVAPIGMIFVPSRGGVSHEPGEFTADEDLVRGADVLLRSALALMRG